MWKIDLNKVGKPYSEVDSAEELKRSDNLSKIGSEAHFAPEEKKSSPVNNSPVNNSVETPEVDSEIKKAKVSSSIIPADDEFNHRLNGDFIDFIEPRRLFEETQKRVLDVTEERL